MEEVPPQYDPPSIAKAYNFFTDNLPHRILDGSQSSGYRLARPGEIFDTRTNERAQLYSVFWSKYSDLGEFGIGIGLYFRQLLSQFVLLLICAFILLPAVYANYDKQKDNGISPENLLKGSAYGLSRDDLSYVRNGVLDFLFSFFLLSFIVFSYFFERCAEEEIDLAQQTCQDYTIMLTNPPSHISDPDAYYHFFSKFGDIVLVTIAKDNGQLMKLLSQQRELKYQLEHDKENTKLQEQLAKIQQSITGLSNLQYHPRRVYITFNTEDGQRSAIKGVDTGLLPRHIPCLRPESAYFEGKILDLREPSEPSEVFWENLYVRLPERWFRLAISWALCSGILVASYFTLSELYGKSGGVAIFVSLLNTALPIIIKLITIYVERPSSYRVKQNSIMLKLILARMVNTAVLIYLVTPFNDQTSSSTLAQVQAILIADAFTNPTLQILNLQNRFMRHFFAPKAKTQWEMNLFFQGTDWNIGERYTNMVKTLFVGLFFTSLIPSALFISSLSMITAYWADKYCLLRIWRRIPMVDRSLTRTSRYMLLFCVWVHLIMACVFFANWPYYSSSQKANCSIFGCETEPWMTKPQKKIVNLFTVLITILTILGFMLFVIYQFGSVLKNCFFGNNRVIGEASNITYRELVAPTAFIPLIQSVKSIDPYLTADIRNIPRIYLPLRGLYADDPTLDPSELCLKSEKDTPSLTDADRDQIFNVVKFYPSKNLPLQPMIASQFQTYPQSNISIQPMPIQVVQPMPIQVVQPMPIQVVQPITSPVVQPITSDESLPEGWEKKISDDGRVYYVDHKNKQTSWTKPTSPVQPPAQTAVMPLLSVETAPSSNENLPYGWEKRFTNDGRLYYIDHNTKKTYWDLPEKNLQANYHQPTTSIINTTPQLPFGWEMSRTNDGRVYYVNHTTKTTQWNPPK